MDTSALWLKVPTWTFLKLWFKCIYTEPQSQETMYHAQMLIVDSPAQWTENKTCAD